MFDLPDNVIFIINEYAAMRLSQTELNDVLHIQSDTALKYFEKNIASAWHESCLNALNQNIQNNISLYEQNYISFDEYIYHALKKHEIEYFADCFKHCECCNRHTFSGVVREHRKPESNVFVCEYENKKCTCSCRHYGRRLQNILEHS